jgi:putative colanic acid biosynthesis acetyltransferase WcaF
MRSSVQTELVDPYLVPAFSRRDRLRRFAWNVTCALLFRHSPRPLHRWRAFLLRSFGATVGKRCAIYPKAIIWAPWNLVCADTVAIADGAIIYNPSRVELGSHCVVSQEAYLCGATHDLDTAGFPLISGPIVVGAYAWLCARCTVQMGLRVSEGAVLGLGAVATSDLEPWTIYAGVPARKIRGRPRP